MNHLLSTLSLNTYECLVKGIKEFNHDNILELKNSVHELEHQADLKKREIEEKLAKEFITPISREDIFLLLDLIYFQHSLSSLLLLEYLLLRCYHLYLII